MEDHSHQSGGKIYIDQPKGDMDGRWECPTRLATGELVKAMIMDIALKCNTLHNEFALLTSADTKESDE